MNKLQAMMMFCKVAECGSFSVAAKRLGKSVSAVTRSVARLEQQLGVQLFVRTTRKVALNEYGRRYYKKCKSISLEIENAETSIKDAQHAPEGVLRIVLPVSFGRVRFLPCYAEFARRYPRIDLDLTLSDRRVDIIAGDLDLQVSVGELGDSRLRSRLLTRCLRVTTASPAYLERSGMPKRPADLRGHNCILSRADSVWSFIDRGRTISIPVKGALQVNGGDALREAALLGLGVAQCNSWLVQHDIVSGRLVNLLEPFAAPGSPVYIVYPPIKYVPLKLRAIIDFLVEIAGQGKTPLRFLQ